MVNLKKYNVVLKHFVIFLTFLFVVSCAKQIIMFQKLKENELELLINNAQNQQIENYIKPYREHIDKDLDSVFAYCPETLDKSKGNGKPHIGNFMADVTLQRGNFVFKAREKKDH